MLVQFDVEPQQTVLVNLQTGMQIVATINIEDLMDGICLKGKEQMALLLGSEIIQLLKNNGSLINAISPQTHIENIAKHIIQELGDK